MRPGTAVTLILGQVPALLMASLNLQLRENLAWDIVEPDGAWRVRSGPANLNNAISGNSGHNAEPEAVRRQGVNNMQKVFEE